MKRLMSAIIAVGLWAVVAQAAVPEKLSIQGILEDSNGDILATAPDTLTFRIYTADSGGTLLWTEEQYLGDYSFDKGVFLAVLGETTLLNTVDFSQALWISIQIGSQVEQTDRIELTSAAYSQMAKDIEDDAVTSAKIAAGAVGATDLAAGAAVTSLNGLTDAVDLVAGTDISISFTAGNSLSIASTATGAGDGHSLDGVSSGPTDAVYVDNDGDVGIGTTSPGIVGHARALTISKTDTDAAVVLELQGKRTSDNNTGWVDFLNYNDAILARIGAHRVSSDNTGFMNFFTGNGGTAYERMRIDKDGDVGIGTTSPDFLLDIEGDATNGAAIELTSSDTGGERWRIISTGSLNTGGAGNLMFHNSTTAVQGPVFDGSGNVGIGQTSPSTFYSAASSNSTLAVGHTSETAGSGLWLVSDATSSPGVYFTDTDNTTNQGYVQYQHTNDQMFFGTSGSLRMTIDSSGHVFPNANNSQDLGTSSKRWKTIYSNNSLDTSDRRLKKEIRALHYSLEDVMSLRPVSYRWKANPEEGVKLGLIAQEVKQVVDEAVHVGDDIDQTMSINYSHLTAVLIKAVQDQQALIKFEREQRVKLEATLEATQRQLVRLNAQMAQVEARIAVQTVPETTLADAR